MWSKRKDIQIAVLVALMAAMGGCVPHYTDVEAFVREPKPIVGAKPYVIEPPDGLRIVAPNAPELNNVQVQLRPDGYITLYLLGDVFAAGKTPTQLASEIEEQVLRYYQDATIQVSVTGFRSKVYYIAGETRTGPRPYTGKNTVIDAILGAGVPRTAWPSKLVILRPDEQGGATQRMSIDFKKMVTTGDVSRNVVLEEGDILYLPTHPLAAIGGAVQNLLMPIDPIFHVGRTPAEMSTFGATTSSN